MGGCHQGSNSFWSPTCTTSWVTQIHVRVRKHNYTRDDGLAISLKLMRKCVSNQSDGVHTSSDQIHRASRLMRNFSLHHNNRHSHTLKCTFGSKWGIVDLPLWAHNDNDARQNWTITGLTLGLRKRFSRRTVTHGMWLQTLGVPFESGITVAFHIVFTGLYQLYAWDRKSLDKQRGITCAL